MTARSGRTTFIATLSSEDSPEWEGNQIGDTAYLTARVSPNGRYLAFMSAAPITGYDNVDANPAAKGARDEEVYLYDSATASLRCVSCNPSGARPNGVLDTEEAGEGLGLLVDRREVWAGGTNTGSRATSRAGPRRASPARCSSRAISPMKGACTSTVPTISCRRPPTARRMSTSTSPPAWAAARALGRVRVADLRRELRSTNRRSWKPPRTAATCSSSPTRNCCRRTPTRRSTSTTRGNAPRSRRA